MTRFSHRGWADVIRFYVLGGASDWSYDTIDEANAHANGARARGIPCFVEARDEAPSPDPDDAGQVIAALERSKCRTIRWAGVAP